MKQVALHPDGLGAFEEIVVFTDPLGVSTDTITYADIVRIASELGDQTPESCEGVTWNK